MMVASLGAQTALTFDGSGNYEDFGKSQVFAISGELTIAAKFKTTNIIDDYPLAGNLIENKSGNYQGYWLGVDTSGHAYLSVGCAKIGQTGYDVSGTSLIDDGEWHHVSGVVSFVGGVSIAKIYVDGVLENELSMPAPSILSDGVFYIGTDIWSYFFQGEIEEISLWARALSESEVAQNLKSDLTGAEKGLVALYQFGGDGARYKEFIHYEWENLKAINQKLLDAEEQKEVLEKGIVVLGVFALFVIMLLLFLRYKAVQSKKASLKQAHLDAATNEREILALKVMAEKRSVQELSLELISKKDFSEKILKKLAELEQVSKSDLMNMEMFIQNELEIKSTQAELQNQMGGLSNNFYNELKIKHPELNDLEVKLAAMVVMRMSNKEISINRNVSPASARVTKNRLKHKMGIPADIEMSDYLNKFI